MSDAAERVRQVLGWGMAEMLKPEGRNAIVSLLAAHDAHAAAVAELEAERMRLSMIVGDLEGILTCESSGPLPHDLLDIASHCALATGRLIDAEAALASAREERTVAAEREDHLREALTVAREEREADRAAIRDLVDARPCPGYTHDPLCCSRCSALALPAVARARAEEEKP